MADEAVLMYETEIPIPVNVADGVGIEKGTVLAGADLFVGAASTADNDVFMGITAEEKVASDGNTSVDTYFGGVFKMTIAAGESTTIGQDVVIKGANTVGGYTTLDAEKGYKIGKALETGAAGETVLVFVGK